MIEGQIVVAPDGLKGLDANRTITPEQAQALHAKGYRFAIRYLRRLQKHDYDLVAEEANAILDAGLGLMLVQHVAPAPWVPTANLGESYGLIAANSAAALGAPPGTMIWCDLEGVRHGVPYQQVQDFCNNWHRSVSEAGYNPGLYVGSGPGLSGRALYFNLRFSHYWSAYNLNSDQLPAVRGVQMRQKAARADDLIEPFTNDDLDVDTTQADHLGGRVHLLTRKGWSPQ